jgi:hypothetical protein
VERAVAGVAIRLTRLIPASPKWGGAPPKWEGKKRNEGVGLNSGKRVIYFNFCKPRSRKQGVALLLKTNVRKQLI